MVKTLVVIAGPTAVGKTATAIRLAQFFETDIVSADSRQIFKEPQIGTAVPSKDELSIVKHYLIGTQSVSDYYNAWMFEKDALRCIDEIFKSHDVAIMVGGSGLYIDAVCNGIDEIPDIAPELRTKINQQFENEGLESLQKSLQKLDPDYYKIVDTQNPARLKRAIEICLQTGSTYTKLRAQKKNMHTFNIVKIALNLPREELYQRINTRVDVMISNGLEEEVRSLVAYKDCTSLKTVGYREFFDYFDGILSKKEAIEKIKQNTRKYAKKQITWLKRTDDYTWFSPNDFNEIVAFLKSKSLITIH